MPTYNSIVFLDSRIQSIQSQVYKSFEVIVIDGYSEDGTWTQLQSVARSDPRWILRQRKPEGVYAALNEAMSSARGEYIYFAMSDDTCDAYLLQTAVAEMKEKKHVDIVQFSVAVIDERGGLLYDTRFFGDFADFFGSSACVCHERSLAGDLKRQAVMTSLYLSLTGIFVRATLVEKAGLFPVSMSEIADVVWTSRLCAYGNSLIYVPRPYATWRRHKRQITANKSRNELAKAYISKLNAIRSLFPEDKHSLLNVLTQRAENSIILRTGSFIFRPHLWCFFAETIFYKLQMFLARLTGGKAAVQRVRGSKMRRYASSEDIHFFSGQDYHHN